MSAHFHQPTFCYFNNYWTEKAKTLKVNNGLGPFLSPAVQAHNIPFSLPDPSPPSYERLHLRPSAAASTETAASSKREKISAFLSPLIHPHLVCFRSSIWICLFVVSYDDPIHPRVHAGVRIRGRFTNLILGDDGGCFRRVVPYVEKSDICVA